MAAIWAALIAVVTQLPGIILNKASEAGADIAFIESKDRPLLLFCSVDTKGLPYAMRMGILRFILLTTFADASPFTKRIIPSDP
ncbi:MAG: hypothetical protein WCO60_15980 [Verrucomicrobiota bacterium]